MSTITETPVQKQLDQGFCKEKGLWYQRIRQPELVRNWFYWFGYRTLTTAMPFSSPQPIHSKAAGMCPPKKAT